MTLGPPLPRHTRATRWLVLLTFMLPFMSVWTGLKATEPRMSGNVCQSSACLAVCLVIQVRSRRQLTKQANEILAGVQERGRVDAGVADGHILEGLVAHREAGVRRRRMHQGGA